jgi:hypothetical protein
MKSRIGSYKNLFLSLLLVLFFNAIQAQDKKDILQPAIEAKHFTFAAETVLPTSGRPRQVTGDRYGITISGDSLRSYLPYFGRVYSAPLNGEGGYNFTSTAFGYTVNNRKKGGWEISIKPTDVSDFREFLLTVSESGSAVLQAMSNNRQPISYNGTVDVQQEK